MHAAEKGKTVQSTARDIFAAALAWLRFTVTCAFCAAIPTPAMLKALSSFVTG